MSVVYIITNTEGTDQFAIQPSTLNGPDGVQQNTDLRLPGMGLAVWGEAYNENVYRLTENFALPEKAGSPGVPQDASDLGTGNGINVPLAGQLWFNTTQNKLFVFDGTDWSEPNVVGSGTSAEVPGACTAIGDLFFDTTLQQLLVCNGTGFVSVADRYLLLDGTSTMAGNIDMGANRVVSMADPVAAQDAVTKNYADTTFVDAAGDTMSGNLDMAGNEVDNLPTPAVGTGGAEGASRDYVDLSIAGLALVALTGDIRMTVDQTIPSGWLECNGDTIGNAASGATHIVGDAVLFDLVKLGFGNGGAEDFASNDTVLLPDFRGRGPISRGIGPTTKDGGPGTNRLFGTEVGDEEHTLTVAEMPSHTHTEEGNNGVVNLKGFSFNPLEVGNTAKQTGATGGDGAHNNMSPSLTVLFLIKT